MRCGLLLLCAVLLAGCGNRTCSLFRCAPTTLLDVTDAQGAVVTSYSGVATIGQDRFTFGCGGSSAPDAGIAGSGICEGSRLRLYQQGDVVIDLTSPSGAFNGVVTTVSQPPAKDADGCDSDCGALVGHVVVR